MANVLTDLAADIYVAADRVGRELTGAASSVTMNANGSERAAVGDTVRSAVTPEATANDIAPSMTTPEGDDQTITNKTATISKSRAVQIPWTGEDMKHVNNGVGFTTVYGDQIAQAMRKLANEVEVDLCTDIYKNASRAVGVAGTTPFGSNFNIVAEARQILVDNGHAPLGDATMVLGTLAGTKLRNLAQLQKANEAGSTELLRNGTLLDLQGVMLKESAGIQLHTKGTGSGYLTNGALAVGDADITVDTGSGTILQGDTVTFAADGDNDYVVNAALSGGSFSIGTPALRQAIADNNAITVGDSYTANFLFKQAAVELIMRAPADVEGGDSAVDVMTVQDPFSGLVFEIRAYKGYRKAMFEVSAAWGYKTWIPDGVVVIKG